MLDPPFFVISSDLQLPGVFFFFSLPGVFLWVFLQLQPTTGAEYGRPFKVQG